MSILNDLFEQIIQSEERIRERFSKIREVNNEIQDRQMKLQDAEDELKSLTGSMVLKNQRLAEEELKFKWFAIRENVLRDKKKELSEKRDSLGREKEKAEETLENERGKFTTDVGTFMSSYDFSGRGQENRMTEAGKSLQELHNKKQRLEEGMVSVQQTQERMTNLMKEKEKLLVITKEQESNLQALATQLQTAEHHTTSLEADKQRVSLKPQNDPEFKRLSDELEAMKDDIMEGIREALKQELQELQQLHLKNELHKQKQQQQQEERKQPYPRQVQSQRVAQNKGRTWREQLNRGLASNSTTE